MRTAMRVLWAAAVVCLMGCEGSPAPATSATSATSAASFAQPLTPLQTTDGRLHDTMGRTVILRGLNHIGLRANGSRPAYRVDGVVTPFEVLFDLQDVEDADFALIASFGYNFIRPVFTWEFAQPDAPPAAYNEAYFRLIDTFLDRAAAHGLYVVFNFGQFGWSRASGGNAGAPDWTVSDTCRALPGPIGTAPPQLSVRVGCSFVEFWQNEVVGDVGLQDAYIALWREAMRRYRDHPAVVMVDLFNEPYGGAIPPVVLGPAFLHPFYRKLAAAIREIDPDIVVGFQPELYHSLGIPVPALQPVGIDNAIFLPHNYTAAYFAQRVDPSYVPLVQDALTRADFLLTAEDARTLQVPFLIGETGWTRTTGVDGVEGPIPASDPTAPPKFGRSLLTLSNEMQIGWVWFAYSSVDPAYGIVLDDVVDEPLMRSIAAPFPRAVGGTIESFSFDPQTRRFELQMRQISALPAEIALPLRWQYPEGVCVTIDDVKAARITAEGQVQRLVVAPALRVNAARALLELAHTPQQLILEPLNPTDCR